MKQTTLITGAAGFIGSALAEHLDKNSITNVIRLSRRDGIDLISPDWQSKIPSCEIDTIVHLAQSTQYREFPAGASNMVAVNVDATLSLLEWARVKGIKRFIFASTGNVYQPSDQVWHENSPLEPSSFYGASKLAAEYLAKQYEKFFEIVVIRLFGVYGPGQSKMLIANVIEKMKKGDEIQLAEGEGLLINPIYIDDVLMFVEKLITCPLPQRVMTLNIAGAEKLSLAAIIRKLERILAVRAKSVVTEGRPVSFIGDVAKLNSIFPDHAFVRADDGLARVCRND